MEQTGEKIKISISVKILLAIFIVLFVILFFGGIFAIREERNILENQARAKNEEMVRMIGESNRDLVRNYDRDVLKREAESLLRAQHLVYVSFWDKEGNLLAEKKLAGVDEMPVLYISQPVISSLSEQEIGQIKVGILTEDIEKIINQTILFIVLYLIGLALVLGIFLFFSLYKIVISPMNQVTNFIKKIIVKGGEEKRLEIKTGDEFEELAKSFNTMLDVIELSKNELVKSKDVLEQKNKEITEANAELERMNKLMTGRELKVIELKKEIEELKKKSGEA